MRSRIVQPMCEAARYFHRQGWLMGTCGNLSARLSDEPYRLLVSASGHDKGRLEPEDFLLVDGDGHTLEGSGRASAELSVHQAIYGLTAARAVYHVHSVPNNLAAHLWASQGGVNIEGIEMLKGLAGKTLHDRVQLPIVANSQDMGELAQNVARGLKSDVPGVLVDRHGLYAWGQAPDEARRHVEVFEFLLDYLVRREALGAR